jgi:general secretion pathway protein M
MSADNALTRAWRGLAAREQRLLAAAAALVALTLTWLVAVQPAWRTLRSAAAENASIDAQWQAMQRQAAEAKAYRAAPPLAPGLAAQALQRATERLGSSARLSLQGDRAVLSLSGVAGSDLLQWLTEARRGARAHAVEANLRHDDKGYSGTLIVAVGGRT